MGDEGLLVGMFLMASGAAGGGIIPHGFGVRLDMVGHGFMAAFASRIPHRNKRLFIAGIAVIAKGPMGTADRPGIPGRIRDEGDHAQFFGNGLGKKAGQGNQEQ